MALPSTRVPMSRIVEVGLSALVDEVLKNPPLNRDVHSKCAGSERLRDCILRIWTLKCPKYFGIVE